MAPRRARARLRRVSLATLACSSLLALASAEVAAAPAPDPPSSPEPPPPQVAAESAPPREPAPAGAPGNLAAKHEDHAPRLVISGDGGAQARLLESEDPVAALFEMGPSRRDDAYGPRPEGVPAITIDQIIRYGLENPYVQAADENIESMRALLRQARFAWVPVIRTSAVLTPGAAIECDDLTLQGENGPFSFQYCRAAGDPEDGSRFTDLQTVSGYFSRFADAGIALRINAEAVVPITTFGKIRSAQQLAKVGVELAELQKLATQQETVLRVHEAHAGLLLARESEAILADAWKILQAERTKIEQELGLGPDGQPAFDADFDSINLDRDPDDLIRLEVGEVELAGRMREARLIEAKALASLWAIAGNAAPTYFDVGETQLVPTTIEGGLADLAHYRSLALENRPEARLADAGVKARKVQEKLARTNFLPDLGAVVRVGVGYANKATTEMRSLYYTGRLNFSNVYFGLALNWNLDFHNDAFALQRARAQRREAEYKRDAARALLLLEVEDAYRALLDAEQQLRFAEIARDKSWKLVISEQTSASIGTSNFDDLRKALTSWAEFEFKRFEAIMKRNTAVAKLSRAVGVPLAGPPERPPKAEVQPGPQPSPTGPQPSP